MKTTIRKAMLLVLLAAVTTPACFFRKGDPEEKTYDVYGTVTEVTPARLVVDTKRGPEEFVMTDASIKGSDFGPGATVHVYYRIRGQEKQVTMVVEKID